MLEGLGPGTPWPPKPRELLGRYGLSPRKALGQHFLKDPRVALKMVDLSGVGKEDLVVELGAGLGILTWALAQRVKKVIAYELDENLIAILQREPFLPPNVEIRPGHILKLNWKSLAEEIQAPLIIFGNLPYYLSGRLIYSLYENHRVLRQTVFMLQKEVVDRLLSPPGTKNYGLLSVLTALLAEAQRPLVLSPSHFYPPPEVSSAVVNLKFKRKLLPPEIFSLLKVAFSQRRKKLLRKLEKAYPLEKKALEKIFQELGLDPNVRAEEVPPDKYLFLAERLKEKTSGR